MKPFDVVYMVALVAWAWASASGVLPWQALSSFDVLIVLGFVALLHDRKPGPPGPPGVRGEPGKDAP